MYVSSYFATFPLYSHTEKGFCWRNCEKANFIHLKKYKLQCNELLYFLIGPQYKIFMIPLLNNNWMTEEIKLFNTCQSQQHFSLSAAPCKRPICRELDLPKSSLWSITSTCTEQQFHQSQNKTMDNKFF